MKIALVHDYLREYGGAERVLEAVHEMWPEAPLYTSFVDWKALGPHAERFRGWDIRTSWVQHNPLVKKFISPLRFLAPAIWGSFDLSNYDVVISSSGWFICRGVALLGAEVGIPDAGPASRVSRQHPRPSPTVKGVLSRLLTTHSPSIRLQKFWEAFVRDSGIAGSLTAVTRNSFTRHAAPLHICYIHHPPRNLYGYATGSAQQNPLIRIYATIINFFLRHYDFETAQAVDYFIANSKETGRRVQKFYRRESTVIYPPVELRTQNSMTKQRTERTYFLSVGRLTWAKRVDLAIQACNKLKVPLKIVGTGKEEAYLRSIAGSTVEFLGSVSDGELAELYAGAKALIFCALDEDFGMVPVEAMAYGVPVIALAQGGVLETVEDGKTGVLFGEPTVEALVEAMGRYGKLGLAKPDLASREKLERQCAEQANKFSKERFKGELKAFIEEKYRLTTYNIQHTIRLI